MVIFAPLAIVFWLMSARNSMSVNAARIGFLLISATIGLSMSTVFLVYTHLSIARVFFMTAAAFGGLSLYGYTTSRSLSAMGSFMVMGLIGLVIASVVNIFLHSTGLQWGLSILGIVIFAGSPPGIRSRSRKPTTPATARKAGEEVDFRRAATLPRLHQHVPAAALSCSATAATERTA